MDPEPVAEPAPAPASERPVRAAAQKAAQKKAEEAEAAAKKKAAGGKASAAALQKKLAAQKEAASAVEAAQKARIEELEAELLRQLELTDCTEERSGRYTTLTKTAAAAA